MARSNLAVKRIDAQPVQLLSETAYLKAERAALDKHEYYDGQVLQMAGMLSLLHGPRRKARKRPRKGSNYDKANCRGHEAQLAG